MSILNMSISTTISKFPFLSFSKSITPLNPNPLFLQFPLHKSSPNQNQPRKNLIIRMGGGPRTFPGGVNKWQWKRMQAKKATQLLKARLCRERQIYEMRKRAEMKAAVMELEKPWEVVERAPTLFSIKADEQLKVLADRFQRPGGFDMWSDNDGPQLFDFGGDDDLPSARFFPKGVVHSIKPYQPFLGDGDGDGDGDDNVSVNGNDNDNDEVALKMAQRKVDMKNRGNSMRRVRGSNEGKRLTPFHEGDLGLEASGPKNYMRSLSMDTEGSRTKSSSRKFRNNGNMRSDSVDSRRGNGDLERRRDSALTSSRRGNGDSEHRTDSALTSFRRGNDDLGRRRDNNTQTSSRRGNGDSERRRDNTTLTGSRRGNGDSERRRDNNTLTSSRWGNGDSNRRRDTALACSRQGNGDSEGSRDNNKPTSLRRGNGDSEQRRVNNIPTSSRRGNCDSERGSDSNTLTSSRRGNGDSERRRDNTTRGSRQGPFERDGGSVKSKNLSSQVFDMSLQRDGSYGF